MTDKPPRHRGLGRGLSALMADVATDESSGREQVPRIDHRLPVESLRANPDQPRRTFSKEALNELAASVREKGIIQPLIVRPAPDASGQYQIVAGERRWRAAQLAGLHDVPVIIRDYSDAEVLEVAIIENIQRSDLNAIDEGGAYRQLIERFGHTQDQLAQALGKSRSHIANLMRLLTLPVDVQGMVITGALTPGHARALIGHPEAGKLARQIIDDKLSVREAEELARREASRPRRPRHQRTAAKDPDTVQLEQELSATLKLGVSIEQDKDRETGKLVLRYHNLAQLDDLLRVLSGG